MTSKADAVILAALDVLEKQEEVGNLLIEARLRHPREFVFWLETNLRHMSVATAYRYIKAANLSHLRKNMPAMQVLRKVYLLTDSAKIPGMDGGDPAPPDGFASEPQHKMELFFGILWPRFKRNVIEPNLSDASRPELETWLKYARGPHEFYLEVERRLQG